LKLHAGTLVDTDADAKDLVHDTIERAIKRFHQRDPNKPLKPWACRIMDRIAANQRKRQKLQRAYIERIDPDLVDAPKAAATKIETEVLRNEVKQAYRALPPELRKVLVLLCEENYTYRGAAEFLQIPLPTVQTRYRRAIELLQERFQIAAPVKRKT
jgi:RNA polymerase sigma-70 factor (ECF subfamily)